MAKGRAEGETVRESFTHEDARETPILADVDVVVAGGGLAGTAAAIAAGRLGAETILVERNSVLGGVATAGLMSSITNFYYTGEGKLCVGGLATEIVDRLAEKGGTTPDWRSRSCPHFTNDAETFKLLLLEMACEANVRLLFDAWVAGPIVSEAQVKGVFVETSGGRYGILADITLDATGDAALAAASGASCRHDKPGSSSLEFKMCNVDLEALYRYFCDHPEEYPSNQDIPTTLSELEYHWRERGLLFVPHGAGRHMRLVQDAIARGEYERDYELCYGLDALGIYGIARDRTAIVNSNFQLVDHLDPWQHSQAIVAARKSIPRIVSFIRRHIPGFENAVLATTASDLGVRGTRWLDGEYTLTENDVLEGRRFADTIAMAPYRTRLEGRLQWLPHAFDVPYRVMVPKEVDGLLVCSGKSASTLPRGILRGQARCIQLGEAAGVAAALAVKQGVSVRTVGLRTLQRQLLKQGVYLGDDDLLRERGLDA